MPGINIPLSEVGYYVITLLICTVVHEVGHAIAAVRYVCGQQLKITVLFKKKCQVNICLKKLL